MRVFIEYKRKGATTVYILQIFFPRRTPTKTPFFLFFFSFSLSNKRSQVRFEIRKMNLGIKIQKCHRRRQKVPSRPLTSFSREEKKDKERTPPGSRPPTRSTPFLTAETLKVRRDSSNSSSSSSFFFFLSARREESLVVLFKVVVSGVEGVSRVGSD